MAKPDDNRTSVYGDSDRNKTTSYGNSDNQKTAAYSSNPEHTSPYIDQHQKATTHSTSHGIGVGSKIRLKNSDYSITAILSEGTGEAVIYKVLNNNHQVFALKLYFEFNNVKEEPNYETLQRIKEINDPDILKLHDFGVGADKYLGRYCYEISDYAEGGDLFAVVDFKAKYTSDFIEKWIVPQVLKGIKKLHDFKIYHCDLKPGNILFKDHTQTDIVIGDYGSAKAYDLDTEKVIRKSSTVKGTESYLPPEQARGMVSEKNDYYSFGMILLHLLYPDQIAGDKDYRVVDKKKFDQIDERQYNLQPVVDFNPSYRRLNTLIEGLTMIHHSNRFGRSEVDQWLMGEDLSVKYKTSENSTVQPVKLGYATIFTDKDLIEIIETRDKWWEELFEDNDTYSAVKAWLGSFQDINSRKKFDEIVRFYSQLGRAYLKEAVIRYFEPDRSITMDFITFNFFKTDDLKKEVENYIAQLDKSWNTVSFEIIRIRLFQLEFSLRQLGLSIGGRNLILVNSLINKIFSSFGITAESFEDLKTQLHLQFTLKNEHESYCRLIELFYTFNTNRKYKDTKNRPFNDIQLIALSYASSENLFTNKYCKAELVVFMKKKKLDKIPLTNLNDFLFTVFNDKIKSRFAIGNILFEENSAIVYYTFRKSITEFLATKSIKNTIIDKGENNQITLKTELTPSAKGIYTDFITSVCQQHKISQQSIERISIDEALKTITEKTKTYLKLMKKEALNCTGGLMVYLLPIAVVIIGCYVLFQTPQPINDYLYQHIDSDSDGSTLRTAVLIGFIYGLIIVSFVPAMIYWEYNKDNSRHSNFHVYNFLIPLHLVGGILVYAFWTVVGGFILTLILFVVVGIGSIFGDYKTDPTVDLITNFLLKFSALVIFGAVFRPLIHFSKSIDGNSKIVKNYISLQTITIFAVMIAILSAISSIDISWPDFGTSKDTESVIEVVELVEDYVVVVNVANIRAAPSADSELVGKVYRNTVIQVVAGDENDSWYRVSYNNSYAYIKKTLLKRNN